MAIKWVLLEPFVSLKSWATGGWGNFFTKSHPSRFFYEELAQGALEKMSSLRGPLSGDLTEHTFFIESGKGLTEASF